MKRLDPRDVRDLTRLSYGLPPSADELDLLAASLRRAASHLAPCRKAVLIREALQATRGILTIADPSEVARTLLERLLAVGDLLEVVSDGVREIYLGAPACVRLGADTILVLGVRPLGLPLISPDSAAGIQYRGGLRYLSVTDLPLEASVQLTEHAFQSWLGSPQTIPPQKLVDEYRGRTSSAGQTGNRPGLSILDSETRISHYASRWREPKPSDNGVFIGRRPVEFGARAWSVCLIEDGHLSRFLDLPVTPGIGRGRDEAWRLQAALDAARGVPQSLSIRQSDLDHAIVDFFGPIPSFASRYFEALGEIVPHAAGALLSYRIRLSDVDAVTTFTSTTLWMSTNEGPKTLED
jgi:hypothetical protein